MNKVTFNQAAQLLGDGKVGVAPSDTIYGLFADARNQVAVQRIYNLKQRSNKPGTLVAASAEELVGLGISTQQLEIASVYWPGAVSVVLPCSQAYLTQGLDDIAVRVPSDKTFRALLAKTGPLQTSSANIAGEPAATTLKMAQNYFGDEVDFYVDGGDLADREPSTIIRITDNGAEVLREGAVKLTERSITKL